MSSGSSDEPPLSLPPEMLRELASAGVDPDCPPNLEQWQTLLLRFAHHFREESNPLHFASSALGHELRTPMTVVIGASELLLESELDPEQRQAAQNVHRSGQELLSVIDQMLSDVTEAKSTPPRAAGPASVRFDISRRRFRALLAEDNEFNRALIERVLCTLNCDVDLVPSGRDAVRRFHQSRFDLVLMDCHMPDLDGLEATRQIRAGENPTRHVPILAVTAGTVPGARQACLQAGMDDFIAKPFSLATLRRKASHWLQVIAQADAESQVSITPSSDVRPAELEKVVPPVANVPVSVDLTRLKELAEEAGSPRIVEELSLIFVEDMERRLESLREATDERVERTLLSVIHAVKGACGNFGAVRMASLAEAIERRAKRGDVLGLDLEVSELCSEFQIVRRVLDLEVFGVKAERPPPAELAARIG